MFGILIFNQIYHLIYLTYQNNKISPHSCKIIKFKIKIIINSRLINKQNKIIYIKLIINLMKDKFKITNKDNNKSKYKFNKEI